MITGIITVWFSLTALSALFVTYDLLTNTPAMGVMKLGWVLVVLYTGPVGLFIYLLSCREPLPGTHELFIAPLWKQAVGSTIHCLAGDATGIILAAVITSRFEFPRALDIIIWYGDHRDPDRGVRFPGHARGLEVRALDVGLRARVVRVQQCRQDMGISLDAKAGSHCVAAV